MSENIKHGFNIDLSLEDVNVSFQVNVTVPIKKSEKLTAFQAEMQELAIKFFNSVKSEPTDVWITNPGPSKISAIKVVRELTYCGLKEAKDLIESQTPIKVNKNKLIFCDKELTRSQAIGWMERLKEAGCTVHVGHERLAVMA